MGSKIDIPLVYTVTDPAALKRDLNRLAKGIDQYTLQAAKDFRVIPVQILVSQPQVLAFDMTTRIALNTGGNLVLQLPQPDVKNGQRALYIKRETTVGNCTIKGVGCTINGRSSKLLPAAPGLYTITFDGANYFSNPQLAADWGG
jgi:hypothetical protein